MTHLYVDLPINILISKLKRDIKNELIKNVHIFLIVFLKMVLEQLL